MTAAGGDLLGGRGVERRKSIRRGGPVVPERLGLGKRVLAGLIYGFIRGMAMTARRTLVDGSGVVVAESPEPVIFCVWHNRLAFSLPTYELCVRRRQPARRMAAMVSASKDGAVVARVLEHFGAQPVRGSSSRRGAQALLELTTWAERGYDLAITPDGPRGPCYRVQEGVVAVAQLTGLPILPAAWRLGWKKTLRSWDRFQIPLPFSRWEIVTGPLVRVPRDVDEAGREKIRAELEACLLSITRD